MVSRWGAGVVPLAMISKWQWHLREWTRRLWVRATFFAVLGVGCALVAYVVQGYVPLDYLQSIGSDSVGEILNILASSMLAVTTFSMAVVVAAYSSAAQSATPRATRLLMNDSATQNALATFLGSFLFSIVGIIALGSGVYDEHGRAVLFVVTIVVVGHIVITLLRWIDRLSRLGRLSETTARVEEAARGALLARAESPSLGCNIVRDASAHDFTGSIPVFHERIGYVQHVDFGQVQAAAKAAECRVYLEALPGTFIHPARPTARVLGKVEKEQLDAIRDAFSIDADRTFDQDPRFGLVVLSEVASRALSPAVNDPGTAIGIIGRLVRLLSEFATVYHERLGSRDKEVVYDRVWVSLVSFDDLFDDAFTSLGRDGAAMVEVQVRLQKALWALHTLGARPVKRAAERHSRLACARANAALSIEEDRERVHHIAAEFLPPSVDPSKLEG